MGQMFFESGKKEKLFAAQLNNLAYANKNGVLNGCVVSATNPISMNVDVSSGRVFFGSRVVSFGGDQISINENTSEYLRYDLICVDQNGDIELLEGTPSMDSSLPEYNPENYVVLALIEINPFVIAINKIKDLRVENVGGGGSNSGGTFGKYVHPFTSLTTVNVVHNLGDLYPMVKAYGVSGDSLEIVSVSITGPNSLSVSFASSQTGDIVVYGGRGVNNSQFIYTFSGQTSIVVPHNLNSEFVRVDVINNNLENIAPTLVRRDNPNEVTINFSSSSTGTVIVTGGSSDMTSLGLINGFTLLTDSIDVNDSASQILDISGTRLNAIIYNNGVDDIYLGKNGVTTTSNSWKLVPLEHFEYNSPEPLYAIKNGASLNYVRIYEVRR